MNIFTTIKQTKNFTESETIFADYILNHPHDVLEFDIQQLSKNAYVSASTIYRVIDKLGLSGLTQLKVQISLQLEKNKQEVNDVDYNYPFNEKNTQYQITAQMLTLYEQTVKNTFNLIDLDVLLNVVQALKKAHNIYIFPSIGNYFMAESFQQNMLEIGVRVEVISEAYYQHWHASLCDKNDIVIIISYSAKTPQIMRNVNDLKDRNVPIVLISSTKHTPVDEYAKYHLYFSSYEDHEEKIASFSSRLSLQYLLDCIYACYFNRDYQKNLEYRIKNYI